jgi:hypothetical protein
MAQRTIELQRGTPAAAYELLRAAADAVADEDPARALELQAEAITPAFLAGWPERAFREAHGFVKVLAPAGRPFEPFLRRFLETMAAAEPRAGDVAREHLVEAVPLGAEVGDFRLLIWASVASAFLGDLSRAGELSLRAVALGRATGSFNALPIALLAPARFAVNARAFDEAEEWATEGIELTRQLAQENLETCFSAPGSLPRRAGPNRGVPLAGQPDPEPSARARNCGRRG